MMKLKWKMALLLLLTAVSLAACSDAAPPYSPLSLTSGGKMIVYGMDREEIERQIGPPEEEDDHHAQYGDLQISYLNDIAVELRVTNYSGGPDAWETGDGVKVGAPAADALSAYGLDDAGSSHSVLLSFLSDGDTLRPATDEDLAEADVYDVFCINLYFIGDTVAEIRMYDMRSFLSDATISSICPM